MDLLIKESGVVARDCDDDPAPSTVGVWDSRSTLFNGQVSAEFQEQRSIWVYPTISTIPYQQG